MKSIQESVRRVFRWGQARHFLGNDPHDLLESPLFRRVRTPGLRLVILQAGRRSPIDFRPILGVRPMENPKGLALFLSGLMKAKDAVSGSWLTEAQGLAGRLLDCQHINGGWGYPFAWQSRTHYLAANHPTVVCTSFVAQSLLDLFDHTQDPRCLAAAQRAVDYILRSVPLVKSDAGVAFGYAEADPQIVFNASLLAGELLARMGSLRQDEHLLHLANETARFVIDRREVNGGWRYGLEATQTWSDNFHTAFVLLSLLAIGGYAKNDLALHVARSGFETYRRQFFTTDGKPKYFPTRVYPIDAHSVATSIIALNAFGDAQFAGIVARFAIANMQSPDGYFYYQIHRRYVNRIGYMRWSNAWMFRALTELAREE